MRAAQGQTRPYAAQLETQRSVIAHPGLLAPRAAALSLSASSTVHSLGDGQGGKNIVPLPCSMFIVVITYWLLLIFCSLIWQVGDSSIKIEEGFSFASRVKQLPVTGCRLKFVFTGSIPFTACVYSFICTSILNWRVFVCISCQFALVT